MWATNRLRFQVLGKNEEKREGKRERDGRVVGGGASAAHATETIGLAVDRGAECVGEAWPNEKVKRIGGVAGRELDGLSS
jgi:hypothetical protein